MNEEVTRGDLIREIDRLKKRRKRKNPSDATFRNINALKRRVERLEKLLGIKKGSTPR